MLIENQRRRRQFSFYTLFYKIFSIKFKYIGSPNLGEGKLLDLKLIKKMGKNKFKRILNAKKQMKQKRHYRH